MVCLRLLWYKLTILIITLFFATLLEKQVVNIILKPLIGYPNIAALPISQALLLVALSIGLNLVSGLIPASSAANKDPVVALRTE